MKYFVDAQLLAAFVALVVLNGFSFVQESNFVNGRAFAPLTRPLIKCTPPTPFLHELPSPKELDFSTAAKHAGSKTTYKTMMLASKQSKYLRLLIKKWQDLLATEKNIQVRDAIFYKIERLEAEVVIN